MSGQEIAVVETPIERAGIGQGGLAGAESLSRETALWRPSMRSPDQVINGVKPMADARGRDMVGNDGRAMGVVSINRDSVVGGHYRLSCVPNLKVLANFNKAFDETWSEEFQAIVENRFNLIGESEANYLDAAGRNKFTGMIRLGVASVVMAGEILATGEWLSRDPKRPCSTAVQLVSPDRLSNPDGGADTRYMRRGVEIDGRGRPVAYNIRMAHPTDYYDSDTWKWRRVLANKPWGRQQVIHIYEQLHIDQSRGIADMVSVLSKMRMTKQFGEITLQNAVTNASYAAAIESELPPEAVAAMMGANTGGDNYSQAIGQYLNMLAGYLGSSTGMHIDGVKIPHLFPGTKLNTRPLGTPGGVGQSFEDSLLRHIAAGLGLSFEEFTKDFSKMSYSGGRMSLNSSGKHTKARKKVGADRFANSIYSLWLEEDFGALRLPMPNGIGPAVFYEPLLKEALTQCSWIGAGMGQVDELKETQAAILRIKSGLSTYEQEIARFGGDYREVFAQRAREEGIITKLSLAFSLEAQKSGNKDPQSTMQGDGKPKTKTKKKPAATDGGADNNA